MDINLFAKRVRTLREARGWSRRKLAELVGVSYHQVIKWELATRGTTADRVIKLCEVFGVTPKQFWDENYIPGGLFYSKSGPIAGGVIGSSTLQVDEDGRALSCPRCKNDGYSNIATYCPRCGFPLKNLCSGAERHVNSPSAFFCETCGSKTFWGMNSDELKAHGIPDYV